MNYSIRRACESDRRDFYRFIKESYSNKNGGKVEEYVDFWFSQRENEIERTLIMVDENNRIIGQNFFSSMSYYFNGETIDTAWGFDMIITPECRKENLGVPFMLKTRDAERKMLSVGANDSAMSMLMNMRFKKIGELRRYFGISNVLLLPLSVIRGVASVKYFPISVIVDGYHFKKTDKDGIPTLNKEFSDMMEPARTREWLHWRFFNPYKEYGFYRLEGADVFFVVRSFVKKHITFFELVDLRCNPNDAQLLSAIAKAYKKIARKALCPILFAGSSFNGLDKALEKVGLKNFGRNRPIMWLKNGKESNELIDGRRFAYVTFADSDGEFDY